MRRGGLVGVCLALVAAATASLASAAAAPAPVAGLHTLAPGARPDIAEHVPVNVVVVGLSPGTGAQQVDTRRLTGELPAGGSPIVRVPNFWYGLTEPLGEHWRYVATYLGEANRVLAAIQGSTRAGDVAATLHRADDEATTARSQLAGRRFTAAATTMARAYGDVVAAARQIDVPLAPASYEGSTQPRATHSFHQPGPAEPDDR